MGLNKKNQLHLKTIFRKFYNIFYTKYIIKIKI